MKLIHYRIQETSNSTRGTLFADQGGEVHRWVCELLEDGFRKVKEHGKTRIDPKVYQVVPIKYGRFFTTYQKEHGHKFAIALMDVAGIDRAGRHGNVRVHKLNKVEETDGCPGTGNRVDYDSKTQNFFVVSGSSTPAYLRLYELLEPLYDEATGKFKEDVTWHISEQFI